MAIALAQECGTFIRPDDFMRSYSPSKAVMSTNSFAGVFDATVKVLGALNAMLVNVMCSTEKRSRCLQIPQAQSLCFRHSRPQ